ncbi:MAG: efflux RND transporter periplasmic adaptor subunit [Acetivibrionales bacterium]|jgi:HlyD family secretion protein|nr:efflux RND transporter periplasmic adaptor subunit [Clostridiaceae bacterium]
MLTKKDFGCRLILSLFSLVLILSFFGCTGPQQREEENIYRVPVIVMSVKRGSIESSTQYTGIIKPKRIAYVASVIPGRVSEVCYELGQKVKRGDTLFTVDSKELEANIALLEEQLKVASANISLAETQVQSAMGSGHLSQKNQLEAALTSAEHNYTAAKKVYDAAVLLYEMDKITSIKFYQVKNQFEQAKNALKTADKAYNLYINQLSADVMNSSNQQLEQAKAAYDALKIQLESAREQLKYTYVKSPMDGIIAAKDILEGSLISNTMVPYVIADVDTVQVSVSVTENVINKIKLGQKIEIQIPAAGTGTFIGQISEISPVIDQTTFSYQVLIDVPNHNNLIKSGMTAKVHMQDKKLENVVLAPISAILNSDSGSYVFVVENNRAVKRFVDTGINNDKLIAITKGLQTGDRLIIKGQHYLNHYDPVTITQEAF